MKCIMTFRLLMHGARNIINGTIPLVRSRWLKGDATWHFWSCNAIGTYIGIMWCQWCHQWHHYIYLVKIFAWLWGAPWLFWSGDPIGTSVGITWYQWHCKWHHSIIRSNQLKWDATWHFCSCDATGTGVGTTPMPMAPKGYQCIPWVKTIEMRCYITFLAM